MCMHMRMHMCMHMCMCMYVPRVSKRDIYH